MASGSMPTNLWASLTPPEPWASIPTASMTESAPRPAVRDRTSSPSPSSSWSMSIDSAPRASTRLSRSPIRSATMTRWPRCSAMRAAMSPIGPAPTTSSGPVVGHVGVLDGLPGGRQHVAQEEVAVVGRSFGTFTAP